MPAPGFSRRKFVRGLPALGCVVSGSLRAAEARCRPAVQVTWEQVELAGAAVVAVHVARSTELHSLSDGRVLVLLPGHATGAVTRLLGRFVSVPTPTDGVAGELAADADPRGALGGLGIGERSVERPDRGDHAGAQQALHQAFGQQTHMPWISMEGTVTNHAAFAVI